jgi:Leucine-rich repeat (LRR) protein
MVAMIAILEGARLAQEKGYLDVSNNNLVGQFPSQLPPRLQVLRVSINNLTGTIPASLTNITTLASISCAYNRIKGNIPSEFADFFSLRRLQENCEAIKLLKKEQWIRLKEERVFIYSH